jgi:hypothetical protein
VSLSQLQFASTNSNSNAMSSAAAATSGAPVSLSFKTMTLEQHLVLSAMRKLGKGAKTTSSALATDIQASAKSNPAHTVYMATPAFVANMDETRVMQVMTGLVTAGWAEQRDKQWLLTDAIDEAIKASCSNSQTRNEAQMQQYIVGAFILMYKKAGATKLPFDSYIYFHHLTCIVQLSSKLLGSKLRQWAHGKVRFGPFDIKLDQDSVKVTAHLEELVLPGGMTVFRLATKPVANIAPVEIYRNHCAMTEAELVACARDGNGRGAADGALDIIS